MNFFRKYELVRLLSEGEVKSFLAHERDTGRPVLFHMIQDAPPQAGWNELVAKATRLPTVIEVGEFGGTTFVVTQPMDPFPGLRQWIEQEVPLPQNSVESTPAGEFTRIMGATPIVPPTQPKADAFSGPGEFTRFFGAGVNNDLPTPEPSLAANEAHKPFQPAGEFTRMFAGAEDPMESLPVTARPLPGAVPVATPFDTQLDLTAKVALPSANPALANAASPVLPGEYTRVVAALPTPPAEPPAATESAPLADVTPNRTGTILAILAGIMLLVALVLLVLTRAR